MVGERHYNQKLGTYEYGFDLRPKSGQIDQYTSRNEKKISGSRLRS